MTECKCGCKDEWISVKERLPVFGRHYLVWCEYGQNICFYDVCRGWIDYKGASVTNVTHWMPLPGKPVERKDESRNKCICRDCRWWRISKKTGIYGICRGFEKEPCRVTKFDFDCDRFNKKHGCRFCKHQYRNGELCLRRGCTAKGHNDCDDFEERTVSNKCVCRDCRYWRDNRVLDGTCCLHSVPAGSEYSCCDFKEKEIPEARECGGCRYWKYEPACQMTNQGICHSEGRLQHLCHAKTTGKFYTCGWWEKVEEECKCECASPAVGSPFHFEGSKLCFDLTTDDSPFSYYLDCQTIAISSTKRLCNWLNVIFRKTSAVGS